MKKLSLLLLLAIAFCAVKAQGNLQFNRALNNLYTFNTVGTSAATVNLVITVPTGKVWKIESYTGSLTTSNNPTSLITLGSSLIAYLDLGLLGIGSSFGGPIWLGAGTHSLQLSGQGTNNGAYTYTYNAVFSGIEFNITQ